MSNVSVFVMSNAQYGYYIHGRSPNGVADTNIKQMKISLQKEENDLVAGRGLLPDSKNQVFSISLVSKLRKQYLKVMEPLYEVICLLVIQLEHLLRPGSVVWPNLDVNSRGVSFCLFAYKRSS